MKTFVKSNPRLALALACASTGLALPCPAASTVSGYQPSALVADTSGVARFQDPNLVNPWGLLTGPNGLTVVDNHAGVTSFYNPTGRPARRVVTIPAPGGGVSGPTDVAWNRSERAFEISLNNGRPRASTLLFVTEDGTIAGWNPRVDQNNAVLAVNNSADGAIYKGVALWGTKKQPLLYAANFGQGRVEVYDAKFQLQKTFTDSELAQAGYVPFGIRAISGHLLVTFAFKASPGDDDETAGAGLGYVDEFDSQGTMVRRLVSQGPLNAPWGLAMAPHGFGKMSGALLVGNFGDGLINAFDPATGTFLGPLADPQDKPIKADGLWGLAFGPGSGGRLLYYTAGPDDENHGVLGLIRPVKSHSMGGY